MLFFVSRVGHHLSPQHIMRQYVNYGELPCTPYTMYNKQRGLERIPLRPGGDSHQGLAHPAPQPRAEGELYIIYETVPENADPKCILKKTERQTGSPKVREACVNDLRV